jgi:hypothetical protein
MNGKPEHVKLWKLIRLRWPSASGSISEPGLRDPVSYQRQRLSSASWCGRSSAILAVPPKPLRLTKMPVDMYRSINAMVSVAPEHSRSRTALAFPAAGRGEPDSLPRPVAAPKRLACGSRRCWPTWFDTSKLLKRSRSILSLVPASSFLDQPHIMPSRTQDQKCPFYQ